MNELPNGSFFLAEGRNPRKEIPVVIFSASMNQADMDRPKLVLITNAVPALASARIGSANAPSRSTSTAERQENPQEEEQDCDDSENDNHASDTIGHAYARARCNPAAQARTRA
jgi:hypothetical protein